LERGRGGLVILLPEKVFGIGQLGVLARTRIAFAARVEDVAGRQREAHD